MGSGMNNQLFHLALMMRMQQNKDLAGHFQQLDQTKKLLFLHSTRKRKIMDEFES